ncbi:MAG: glycosyltransferase family 2 protein [Caldilineaceae bacterium]
MAPSPVDCPRVSVGIPTYNRLPMLRRAVDSVLQESYPHIELIITDNASTDGTSAFCEEIARLDPRVRYLRHSANCGAHGNFISALQQATGVYFMWLGDDDWVDPGYIEQCIEILQSREDTVLVCGKAHYYQDENLVSEEMGISLLQESPLHRLRYYFQHVSRNGEYYGLMRRELLVNTAYPTTLGGDWVVIGAMACRGKFVSLPTICINRALGGASESAKSVVQASNATSFVANSTWMFWLGVAFYTAKAILLDATSFAPLTTAERCLASTHTFWTILQRYARPELGSSLRKTKLWSDISQRQA